MKHWKLYILNVFLLVVVGYSILPDFSLDKNNFETVSGLISSVRLEEYENKRSKDYLFKNIARERLILTIADSEYHEYYVSDIYKKYWNELLAYNNSKREITLYLGAGQQTEDPFRIEIDNALVYDTDVQYIRNILIILFVLALTLYNLYHYFEDDIKHTKATVIQTSPENGIMEKVKVTFRNVRDYFLE